MNLEVSASRHQTKCRESGYAMAALLVAISVMAILLTVALPTWKQTMQREKEEELIFRGNQYARAIGAYQRKYANASPQSIDVLLQQHFLRRKFKDPLSPAEDGEFQPLYASTQPQGGQGTQGAGTGTQASTTPSGGIIGVASKNTGTSIRTYNNATHYNEWQFIALQQTTQAGAGGQGTQGGPGTQGQRGQGGGSQSGGSGGGSQTQRGSQSQPQGRGGSQTQGR
jgi:type II secretory pathway pseudopilin PulG